MEQIDSRKDIGVDHASTLLVGMRQFYEDGLHTDMVLCVDGDSTSSRRCHRLILSSVSRLLKLALEDLPEDEEISVVLPGVTLEQLDLLLKFIYTGSVCVSEESQAILSLLRLLEVPVSFSLSEMSPSDETSDIKQEESPKIDEKPACDTQRLQMFLPPSCPIPISSSCPVSILAAPYSTHAKVSSPNQLAPQPGKISDIGPNVNSDLQPASREGIPFSCDHCGITFRREHNFRNHIKSVHPDESNEEIKTLTLGGDVGIEGSNKIDVKSEETDITDPKYVEIGSLNKSDDVDAGSMILSEELTKYQCSICNKDFTTEETLSEHFASKHESDHNDYKPSRKYKYRCTMCDRFFLTKIQLAGHIKKGIHKIFKCKVCSKVLKTQEGLDQHVSAHKCAKNYKCGKCGEEFRWRSEFRRHAEAIHGQIITERSTCSICNKSVVIKRMNEHVRTVHGKDKPLECNICQKKCAKASELKNHMRSHTGERPFSCDQCGATFSYSHILARHKKFHAGARKFGCSLCNKSFLQRSDLVKHTRVHSGEKPFKCDMCDRAFARVDYLKKHSLLHSLPPKFTCSKCGENLTSAESLRRHVKLNHEESSCLKYLTATPQGDVEIANFEDFAFELPNIEIDGENRLVTDGVLEWNVGASKEGISELQAVSLDGGKTLMYVIQNDDGEETVFNPSETNALLVNSTTTVVQGTAIIQGNAILQTDPAGGHHAIIQADLKDGHHAIIQADPRSFMQGTVGQGHLVGEAVIEEEVLEEGNNPMDQGSVVLHTMDAEGIKDLIVPEVFYV